MIFAHLHLNIPPCKISIQNNVGQNGYLQKEKKRREKEKGKRKRKERETGKEKFADMFIGRPLSSRS